MTLLLLAGLAHAEVPPAWDVPLHPPRVPEPARLPDGTPLPTRPPTPRAGAVLAGAAFVLGGLAAGYVVVGAGSYAFPATW
ncbi:MAG: hypothetical protein ACOZNI_13570 [Myxococcota bacterium]